MHQPWDKTRNLDDVITETLAFQTVSDYDRTLIMVARVLKGMGFTELPASTLYKIRGKLMNSQSKFPMTHVG